MAYHEIVLPGTVKNIEVFCVEAGRSHYYDESASKVEKSVGAFKGYYNVASPQVRHAVQTSGNQSEVWAAVAKVTKANGAESSTSAYAALENATDQKATRDAYLRFFNRQPNEFEAWKVKDMIDKNTDITPQMIYYSMMTSEEYRFY